MPISTIGQAGLNAPITLTSPTLTTPNIDSAQFATVSGTAPIYPCRAWVNFNGTGTVAIRASGNVSSITDNGTGYYTVNFTTALPDAVFTTVTGITGSGVGNGPACSVGDGNTASSVLVLTANSLFAATDYQFIAVSVFR